MVGLAGTEEMYPFELSGGMQQRAALVRALSYDPDILLMDEPFGALDAMTREKLTVDLQRIWLDSKKTVVFVTHSISEAVFLGDRVVVMGTDPGRVLEVIDVSIDRPRSLAVTTSNRFGEMVSHIRHLLGIEEIDSAIE
jgi:NitT/TauT family transport system ATP-binding protein